MFASSPKHGDVQHLRRNQARVYRQSSVTNLVDLKDYVAEATTSTPQLPRLPSLLDHAAAYEELSGPSGHDRRTSPTDGQPVAGPSTVNHKRGRSPSIVSPPAKRVKRSPSPDLVILEGEEAQAVAIKAAKVRARKSALRATAMRDVIDLSDDE